MNIYRQQILDHYHNPRNVGSILNTDCKSKLDNPLCGDQIEVFIKLAKDKIKKIKFKAEGCAISIAVMSMLSEEIKGRKVKEVMELGEPEIKKMLGVEVSPTRMKCAMLGLRVLRECLCDKLQIQNNK